MVQGIRRVHHDADINRLTRRRVLILGDNAEPGDVGVSGRISDDARWRGGRDGKRKARNTKGVINVVMALIQVVLAVATIALLAVVNQADYEWDEIFTPAPKTKTFEREHEAVR